MKNTTDRLSQHVRDILDLIEASETPAFEVYGVEALDQAVEITAQCKDPLEMLKRLLGDRF